MERHGTVEISAAQLQAYYWGLNTIKGDPEVLEDLGIPVYPETLLDHVERGAAVAELLQEPEEPDPYAGLSGKQLFRAVREELALRRAS
ncbi:MAG: hypothetical protein ACHQT5_01535 [Candidatus Saccharimonadales bacterium]|jgi:hypothetical protein